MSALPDRSLLMAEPPYTGSTSIFSLENVKEVVGVAAQVKSLFSGNPDLSITPPSSVGVLKSPGSPTGNGTPPKPDNTMILIGAAVVIGAILLYRS